MVGRAKTADAGTVRSPSLAEERHAVDPDIHDRAQRVPSWAHLNPNLGRLAAVEADHGPSPSEGHESHRVAAWYVGGCGSVVGSGYGSRVCAAH